MDYCKVNLLFMNYKKEANNVLDFKKFTVSILKIILCYIHFSQGNYG